MCWWNGVGTRIDGAMRSPEVPETAVPVPGESGCLVSIGFVWRLEQWRHEEGHGGWLAYGFHRSAVTSTRRTTRQVWRRKKHRKIANDNQGARTSNRFLEHSSLCGGHQGCLLHLHVVFRAHHDREALQTAGGRSL